MKDCTECRYYTTSCPHNVNECPHIDHTIAVIPTVQFVQISLGDAISALRRFCEERDYLLPNGAIDKDKLIAAIEKGEKKGLYIDLVYSNGEIHFTERKEVN